MEKNMKQGNGNKSFDDLKAVARDRASRKFDVITNVQMCEFFSVKGKPQHMQLTLPDGNTSSVNAVIDDHAMELIAGYTHMYSYHKHCMKEGKEDLATLNLNRWFQEPDTNTNRQRRMFRFWKPESHMAPLPNDYRLRSFHSSQYMRLDDEVYLDAIIPEIEKFRDGALQIASCNQSDHFLNLKVTMPNLKKEVKVGDYVGAGVSFKNGETGLSNILGGGYLERLWCKNGAVLTDWVGNPFRRKHLTGVQPIGVMAQYWDNPSRYPKGNPEYGTYVAEVRKQIQQLLEQCFSEAQFEKIVERLSATAHESTTIKKLDPPSGEKQKRTIPALLLVGVESGLSRVAQENIYDALHKAGDFTQWGFANAITRTANDHTNYDEATKLEEIGGNIMSFPQHKWQKYAQADWPVSMAA
jgi:hypothetical protein